MANTKQAAKRAAKSIELRATNMSLRTKLRGSIKKVRTAIEGGEAAAAKTSMQAEQSTIDSIARKGIIHKNKAARHKSRLSKAIKALGTRAA
jgi:small subunit ribosomal protein S20